MLQAVLNWAETATVQQTDAVQGLLHQCLGLSSSPSRQVRTAFAQDACALAQPVLLKAMYTHDASGLLQSNDMPCCEAKLLQVTLILLPLQRVTHSTLLM